jgi:enamine deaminase RidA (YjgF/YER057c/UK114 family)
VEQANRWWVIGSGWWDRDLIKLGFNDVKHGTVLVVISFLLLPGTAPAQKKKKGAGDEGMPPPVILEDKKKKTEPTQTLPPPRELPTAVAGETDRLIFQVSPLSRTGLLSQQTRDALRALQRSAHGTTILKLRAFVAGSGDMRRIGELVGELWTDRHTPLPALSVIQTGGLPLEGAQVVVESIAEEHKTVNPNGLVFLSGQPANSLEESLSKLEKIVPMHDSDMLRVTCFVRALDENRDAQRLMSRHFPNAAVNYVQSQREYAPPVAECEGVARAPAVGALGGALPASGSFAMVAAHKVVLSATQLSFGTEEGDLKLAFDRLQRSLAPFQVQLNSVAMTHVYVMSRGMSERVRAIRPELFKNKASTIVQVEGLPSLDASLGVDVVAVPSAGSAARAALNGSR